MLAPAFYHKDKLTAARAVSLLDPRMAWWNNSSYVVYDVEPAKDSWEREQFVSLDATGAVVGFLSASIDRDTRHVSQLSVARFVESPVFHRDLLRFIRSLHRYRSVVWSVVVGNPAEAHYDSICARYGGRIVGVTYKTVRLMDGRLYDEKRYQIVNSAYRE